MIFQYSDYRQYLSDLLTERKKLKASYSLRAMALSFDVAPSMLSEVLSGKKSFSSEVSEKIADRLKLTRQEKNYFCTLVQLSVCEDDGLKNMLIAQMRALNPKLFPSFDISLDHFEVISEWYHFAILEMTLLQNFKPAPEFIASKLGITPEQALAAIERLKRLGLVQSDALGGIMKNKGKYLTSSDIPNEALRRYHFQMLHLAQKSLRTQTPQEKFVGSETIPISSSDLPVANEIIESCFQRILQLAHASQNRDQVYHIGIQMFKLTTGKTA